MRLYELPKGAKIFGLEPNGNKDDVVVFDHVDGMYSYCTYEDDVLGECTLHLLASMPVVKFRDGYIFDASEESDNV